MYDASPSGPPARQRRRRPYGQYLAFASAAAIALAALPRFSSTEHARPDAPAPATRPAAATKQQAASLPPGAYDWILDPTPILGPAALSLAESAPLAPAFEPAYPLPEDVTVIAQAAPEPAPQPKATPAPARVVQLVPLPVPRPAELRRPAPVVRLAERPVPQRQSPAARQDAQAERSFFETVFGASKPTGPALAYAPIDNGAVAAPKRPLAPAPFSAGGGTAIYDINARTVTLPSGERLEAHSGLGETMDNPRYVHLRGRGSTPPGTYDLTEREAPFHGVRALRMHPVGGPNAVYGRNGLLTHSYLRGPSGASSGCISFRHYDRFLQAYLRGEVRRVVVVGGSGDGVPSFAGLFGGGRRQTARAD